MDILGAPINDCANFIAGKRDEVRKLLSQLEEVAVLDLHVFIMLLCICGSYCWLIHLARATPSLASEALSHFDNDVRQCFTQCLTVETQDVAWCQAQLSLSFGGVGLCSLSAHFCAAYIASLCSSGLCVVDNQHCSSVQ